MLSDINMKGGGGGGRGLKSQVGYPGIKNWKTPNLLKIAWIKIHNNNYKIIRFFDGFCLITGGISLFCGLSPSTDSRD